MLHPNNTAAQQAQPIDIWQTYKSVVPWVIGISLVYLGLIPWLWPRPNVAATLPTSAALGEDIPLEVTVSAWHSNFRATRVCFWVDPLRSNALVEQAAFYPIDVRDIVPRTSWPQWSINRVTWPRSRSYNFTVPLNQRWREGVLQAGVLQGMIWVTTETPNMGKNQRASGGGRNSSNSPQGIPFTLTITPVPQQQ